MRPSGATGKLARLTAVRAALSSKALPEDLKISVLTKRPSE